VRSGKGKLLSALLALTVILSVFPGASSDTAASALRSWDSGAADFSVGTDDSPLVFDNDVLAGESMWTVYLPFHNSSGTVNVDLADASGTAVVRVSMSLDEDGRSGSLFIGGVLQGSFYLTKDDLGARGDPVGILEITRHRDADFILAVVRDPPPFLSITAGWTMRNKIVARGMSAYVDMGRITKPVLSVEGALNLTGVRVRPNVPPADSVFPSSPEDYDWITPHGVTQTGNSDGSFTFDVTGQTPIDIVNRQARIVGEGDWEAEVRILKSPAADADRNVIRVQMSSDRTMIMLARLSFMRDGRLECSAQILQRDIGWTPDLMGGGYHTIPDGGYVIFNIVRTGGGDVTARLICETTGTTLASCVFDARTYGDDLNRMSFFSFGSETASAAQTNRFIARTPVGAQPISPPVQDQLFAYADEVVWMIFDSFVNPVTGVFELSSRCETPPVFVTWERYVFIRSLMTYLSFPEERIDPILAARIRNLINAEIEYTLLQDTVHGKWHRVSWSFTEAHDDVAWVVMSLMDLRRFSDDETVRSALLDHSKTLIRECYGVHQDRNHPPYDGPVRNPVSWYDDPNDRSVNGGLGGMGGLFYNDDLQEYSMYSIGLAMAALEIAELGDEDAGEFMGYTEEMYYKVFPLMERSDGLYYIEFGYAGVSGKDNPYSIGEAGSISALFGNMAVAVLHMRMGDPDAAAKTAAGIVRYQSMQGGFTNDRDGGTNATFAGWFVDEVVNSPQMAEKYPLLVKMLQDRFAVTAASIMRYAIYQGQGGVHTDEDWQGMADRRYLRADWYGPTGGNGEYRWSDGHTTPMQANTNGTTAHIVIAAALASLAAPSDAAASGSRTQEAQEVTDTADSEPADEDGVLKPGVIAVIAISVFAAVGVAVWLIIRSRKRPNYDSD